MTRSDPPIATLDAWLLRLPLVRPYKLAFGPVDAFDTLIVRVVLGDGREGFGEATLLTGYTDETIGQTWRRAGELLVACEGGAAVAPLLDALDATHPFLTTAFRTALEMAEGSPLLDVPAARVPVLGLLQADAPERMRDEVETLLAQGFRTLKLKVGFDAIDDARMVEAAQRAVAGRARLRLDANQGYDAQAAHAFVERLAHDDIELFEQPCAADDWEAHASVVPIAARRRIPLMLDESIYTMREIERTASEGLAAFVKVKLMKFSSLARLDAALARIRALGLVPVLGNGVANELGCWMEACIATRRIDNAGEMNGFVKPRVRLFARPLVLSEGAIEIGPHVDARLDPDALAAHALAHRGVVVARVARV